MTGRTETEATGPTAPTESQGSAATQAEVALGRGCKRWMGEGAGRVLEWAAQALRPETLSLIIPTRWPGLHSQATVSWRPGPRHSLLGSCPPHLTCPGIATYLQAAAHPAAAQGNLRANSCQRAGGSRQGVGALRARGGAGGQRELSTPGPSLGLSWGLQASPPPA